MNIMIFLLSLDFYAERIKCAVSGDTLKVDATYYMRSAPGSKFCLLYPLPQEGADFSLVSTKNCKLEQRGEMWVMCMEFGADSLLEIGVIYKQRFPNGMFRYITTTTQAWGKPLDWAEFSAETPWRASISYPPDAGPTILANGNYLYRVRIEDFMPEEDFIIKMAEE
ncbi:MAG: hypothetical protein ACP5QG_03185 [candidate division WOR-3 bacterium]